MNEGEHRTVLIVDDEANSRELVRRKLKGELRVLMAACGREALELFAAQTVDIVIMDVMMPEFNGYQVCEKIKAAAQDAFLPVILLTALNQQEDRNQGLAAGADEFLSKPVNSRELNLRVKALLRIREQDITIRTQRMWLKRAVDRVVAINKVGALLSSSVQGGDPCSPATQAVAMAFDLDLAAICLQGNEAIEIVAATPKEGREEVQALLARPGARRALETGELQVGREDRRVCWAPLRDMQRTLGLLVIRAKGPDPLANDDLNALSTLATQIAMGLRNHEFVGLMQTHTSALGTLVQQRTASLVRQNRFTSQIIDSLPISLYVVDRDRTVVAWNRQRELGELGVPREKAVGRSLHELFDRQNREALDLELGPVFDRGEKLDFERTSTVDGEERHFRVLKLPMRLDPGEVTHVVTISEDITEQRRMEKTIALTEKMAAVGRLAAGVAHEINNPLATIATCAEALQGRLEELPGDTGVSDEFREYLQIVEQESYRAKQISEDLLDFSRSRPSSRKLQDLGQIVERTLVILKHHAGFKRVEVERHLEEAAPQVNVEENALVQVLVALIINALDSMPDGGRLTLSTGSSEDEVRCAVQDTGCGIAAPDLPNIFDPFFTTKPAGRGTGLGLAVCYGIVEAHGGRVEVDSRPGKGSRFTVVLPAAQTSPKTEESSECHQPILSGS